jgi:hypothetical protein
MRSRITMAIALAASSVALANLAPAQSATPSGMHLARGQWAVDGSIGFAVPVGDYGRGLSTGLDVMGAVEYHPPTTGPFYFRGEIGYSHFGASVGGGSSNVLRIDADGLYDFPLSGTALNIYALAGLGLYHVSANADVCGFDAFGNPISCGTSSTGFGINLGAGLRYPINPLQLFFELRYQLPLTAPGILSDAPFFPFQFGVRYVLP